jgi:hypothetical protein
MEAILKFNLPEDREDFDLAITAHRYSSTLWEIDQWLRGELKHGDLPEETYTALDRVRKKLWEIASENNISLL